VQAGTQPSARDAAECRQAQDAGAAGRKRPLAGARGYGVRGETCFP